MMRWDEVGVKLWDMQVGRQVVEKQNTQKWKKSVEKTEEFQDFSVVYINEDSCSPCSKK